MRKLRGSGVRFTIPFLGRFAGLWLLVTVAAVTAAAVSSYLVFAERMGEPEAGGLLRALALHTGVTLVAVVALAVFTTHRLAGPWIAVQRALDAVRDGDLRRPLRFRASDRHLREVERAFDEMLAALRARLGESDAA